MRRLLIAMSWTTGIGHGSHWQPIQPMQPRLLTLQANGGKTLAKLAKPAPDSFTHAAQCIEFMPRPSQDYAARRSKSFDTENNGAGYDCELPPGVRSELVTPRRPPIPPLIDRPIPVKTQPRGPLYFVLIICAVVIG